MAQHEMVDLKRKASEDDDSEIVERDKSEAFFPLSLHVGSPEVEKLGLGNAEVGEEHDFLARVRVTSVSVSEDEDSERRESVTLTLLAGEVRSGHSDEERARKLFGGG